MKYLKFLFLSVIVLIGCNSENQTIKWENDIKPSKTFYELDSSRGSDEVNTTYTFDLNASTLFGEHLELTSAFPLYYVFVDVNNKPILVPHKTSLIGSFLVSKDFSYNLYKDFEIESTLYPNGNYIHSIKLCHVCIKEKESQKAFDIYTAEELYDTSYYYDEELDETYPSINSKTISKTAQKLFLEYEKTQSSEIISKIIRPRVFQNINPQSEWCKHINMVANDTIFTFTESSGNILPKQFKQFKNIDIKESGNYLDTLIFKKKEMRRHSRNYFF